MGVGGTSPLRNEKNKNKNRRSSLRNLRQNTHIFSIKKHNFMHFGGSPLKMEEQKQINKNI